MTLKDGREAILRALTAADARELADFNGEIAEDYGNQVADPDEAVTDAGALEDMLRGEDAGFLLGAFRDSSLLGTVSVFVVSLRKVSHVGELALAVRPAFKGLGLGRALLDAAFAEARRRGLLKLVVRVFALNEPALALYRSTGFAEEGHQLRHYLFRDGAYRDGIWMAKFLD